MIAALEDLQKLSGLKRRTDIRRWLTTNGIAFMVQPSGNPVTTLDAINVALYGSVQSRKPNFSPTPPCSRRKSTKETAATSTSTKTSGTHSAASTKA